MTSFTIKRIYEPATDTDGYRVLVDRLWPRGVSKDRATLDEWAKEISPSNELRKWFKHDSEKFQEFSQKYLTEVEENPKFTEIVSNWDKHDKVTLLYGAKDEKHNEAIVLQGIFRRPVT
ncbi:MAG: DUF488 domain-containing protein [Micrococcaceae bacterium]